MTVDIKMNYKNILCFFLGHKHVEKTKGLPFTTMASSPVNDKYYIWDSILCERCVMYHEYKIYTIAEWEKILVERADEYLKELEKVAKNIIGSLPPLEQNFSSTTIKNKMFH